MPYAQLVVGPAGSGKSTYCYNIHQHCQSIGRTVHVINLDPAADEFRYPVVADVRELISLDDVMEEEELGPNGALMFCMEYLEDNLDDWLADQLEGYTEDDLVIFDCPGQLELYSHHSAFKSFTKQMNDWGWKMVCVYVLDAQFITDGSKFIAGCLQAQSAMLHLALPHVNIFSKVDMLEDKSVLDPYLTPDHAALAAELDERMNPKYKKLNRAIASVMEDFSLISFVPMDISDEDSMQFVMYQCDCAIGFGEDADVRTSRDVEYGDEPDLSNLSLE
jgi:GTPase SAR1 family protein